MKKMFKKQNQSVLRICFSDESIVIKWANIVKKFR